MDEKQTRKFTDGFAEVKALARRYSMAESFDPYLSPSNFSSLDAIIKTRNTIIELGNDVKKDQGNYVVKEIYEIKRQLAIDGFDADMAWEIIQRGFYFRSQYFTGSRRISKGHLERNTGKCMQDFDKKLFEKELRKLMNARAVMGERGYALNHRTKEFEHDSIRNVVNYVLSHHSLENGDH